ncbi:hypothetical protein LCGC14_1337100 [marine sediment metagenome]|uniref:Uncharacterized protein n=1 Tax=marine sediment metagenome TaxID=412755 RepID=A0A0F9KEN9_9ZZZZ
MTIKFQEQFPDKFEGITRECQVCGEMIKKGDFIHKCSKKKLKNIERARRAAETKKKNKEQLRVKENMGEVQDELTAMLDKDYIDLEEEIP